MKKQDLKTGMRVRMKNGGLYLVLKDCETMCHGHQDIVFANFEVGYINGDRYNDNLMRSNYEEFDIIEVFTTESGFVDALALDKTSLKSIWKREEKKKMTVSEIEKKLGYEVEIVSEVE